MFLAFVVLKKSKFQKKIFSKGYFIIRLRTFMTNLKGDIGLEMLGGREVACSERVKPVLNSFTADRICMRTYSCIPKTKTRVTNCACPNED